VIQNDWARPRYAFFWSPSTHVLRPSSNYSPSHVSYIPGSGESPSVSTFPTGSEPLQCLPEHFGVAAARPVEASDFPTRFDVFHATKIHCPIPEFHGQLRARKRGGHSFDLFLYVANQVLTPYVFHFALGHIRGSPEGMQIKKLPRHGTAIRHRIGLIPIAKRYLSCCTWVCALHR